jgi:hypothetical protein
MFGEGKQGSDAVEAQQLHQRKQLERCDIRSLDTAFWWAIQLEDIVKFVTRARVCADSRLIITETITVKK